MNQIRLVRCATCVIISGHAHVLVFNGTVDTEGEVLADGSVGAADRHTLDFYRNLNALDARVAHASEISVEVVALDSGGDIVISTTLSKVHHGRNQDDRVE